MTKNFKRVVAILGLAVSSLALAETSVSIPMYFTAEKGIGKSAGSIEIREIKYGLLLTPNLRGLKPELHGFHIHQNPSCDNQGMSAGGHFDPQNTNKHLGPYNDQGHLGDLPALYVSTDSTANLPVLAPRLQHLGDIKNHALMIHEGGDNYSDTPTKLGGGGMRMVCGVMK